MADIKDTESVFIQDDELYNKTAKPVVAPERKRDVDLSGSLYDNIIEATISSQLDIGALSSLNTRAEDRNQMYNIYDVMCEDGSVGAVVEAYAEDATERNEHGDIVWVESDKPEVAKCVEYFLDTMNVNKNIFKWCYSLCKYGDLYLRLYRESEYEDDLFIDKDDEKKPLNEDVKIKAYSKNDKYAHYLEMVSNPATMFELTKFGKTVGYIKAPVNNTIIKNTNTSFTTFNYAYKFMRDDIIIYPATEFVHAALQDDVQREDETVDIFINTKDYDVDENAYSYKVRRGDSLLSGAYKTWRELQLLEDSVLLNRITKSSIVRMINVEVGDMPKENVTKTLLGIKQMIEQKSAIKTGDSMTEYTNPGPIENNVYVPTHEGIGTISTTQIGGDVDVKSLADLDYYRDKLYGELAVLKQYFGWTEDGAGFNGGTSLSIISSRYAKRIKRIQNTIIQALTDAINLMLLDKGLDSYVNEFTIHMLPPTTQEEIDRRENQSSKVQLTSDILNMLSDIEDPKAKLRILKSLIANLVEDTDIVQIIQEQIDALESENAVENEESIDNEENIDVEERSQSETTSAPTTDLNTELGMTEPAEQEESETVLPNANELGVDLSEPE